MADPFLKFYTSDWRSDPRLRMCSAGSRGAWIEMICLMHEATPYGHLLIHGQTPNEAQLASLTGIPAAELNDYVAELERLAVFSRTREGVIYSRKLVRMASRAATARKNGRKGGNPTLSNDERNFGSVNLPDKPPDKSRSQKPETRKVGSSEPTNARAALCEVIRPDTADAFIAHRKAMRAALTPRAAQLIAGKLAIASDPDAAVLTSIERGWKGVFPEDQTSPTPIPGGQNDQRAYVDRRQKAANEAGRDFHTAIGRSRSAPGGDFGFD